VGEVEAKLAAQQMANQACDLRVHGIPFIEGENFVGVSIFGKVGIS